MWSVQRATRSGYSIRISNMWYLPRERRQSLWSNRMAQRDVEGWESTLWTAEKSVLLEMPARNRDKTRTLEWQWTASARALSLATDQDWSDEIFVRKLPPHRRMLPLRQARTHNVRFDRWGSRWYNNNSMLWTLYRVRRNRLNGFSLSATGRGRVWTVTVNALPYLTLQVKGGSRKVRLYS